MKILRTTGFFALFLSIVFLSTNCQKIHAQSLTSDQANFWNNVQFGGAIGLGFGDGYFNGTLAPSAIYNFNRYAAMGTAINFTYVKERNFYESYVVGG